VVHLSWPLAAERDRGFSGGERERISPKQAGGQQVMPPLVSPAVSASSGCEAESKLVRLRPAGCRHRGEQPLWTSTVWVGDWRPPGWTTEAGAQFALGSRPLHGVDTSGTRQPATGPHHGSTTGSIRNGTEPQARAITLFLLSCSLRVLKGIKKRERPVA